MPLDVTSTRGNRKSDTRSNIYLNFFTQRVTGSGSWNTLPDEVVTANNIGSSSLN